MGGVSANFSSSMMENHIPASVLDASRGFNSLIGSDGSQFVLSIGNDQVFRASADASNGVSDWTTSDIANPLLNTLTNATVKAFAASYDPVTGTITIALAVGQTGKGDALYVAHGLDSSASADWISNGGTSITWNEIAYDSTAFDTINADNLDIHEITLLIAEQYGSDETAQSYVVIFDTTSNQYHVFSVVIPPSTVQSGKTAWNLFPSPFDPNKQISIAAGQVDENVGQGLYVLGTDNDIRTLDFVPQDGGTPVSYSITIDASAIASLVQPDKSKQQQSTITELYVTDGNSLKIFSDSLHPTEFIAVENSKYLADTSVLQAFTNYGEDGVDDDKALVVVFGLNGNGQVFYTYALYEDRRGANSWAPVVVLMQQVSAIAPIVNSGLGTLGFMGISADMSVSSPSYKTSQDPVLVAVNTHPVTLDWQRNYLPVPVTDDYIRLQTYTSKLRVVDPTNNNLPLGNQKLQLTSLIDARLLVNGVSKFCAANEPVDVMTDATGTLTVANTVSGLSAIRFNVTDEDGNPVDLLVNGQAVTQPYDPTDTVKSTLTSGMTGDLNALQYKNSDGSTSQLVPKGDNTGTASQAFTNIHQNMPSSYASDVAATRGHGLAARAALAKRRRERAGLEDDDGVEVLLGDLVQWAISAIDDVAKVFADVAGGVLKLTVNFAEGAFYAVIDTVEDAFNAVVSLFKWIGAEFEKIFRWLAFIFDWDEMVAVHTALANGVNTGLTAFAKDLSGFQKNIDTLIDNARTEIKKKTNPFGKASGNAKSGVASKHASSSSVGGTDMSSDPKVSWVGDQLKNSQSATVSAGRESIYYRSRKAPRPADSGSLFADSIASFGSTSSSRGNASTMNQVNSSANGGSESIGDAIWGVVGDIGDDILGDIETGFDDAFKVADMLVEDAQDCLNDTINIPVISGIYNDFVGHEPTTLDITCLCAGIVVTISYNVAKSIDDSLPDLKTFVQSDDFTSMFSTFGVGQTLNRRQRRALKGISPENHKGAVGLLGGLMVLQGFAVGVGMMAEDFESSSTVTVAKIVELILAFIVGCMAASISDDEDYADFKTFAASVRLLLLLALAQAVFMRGGLSGTEAKEICFGSEVVDSIIGAWALIDILVDLDDAEGEDWLDMFLDLMAFPGAFCAHAKLEIPFLIIGVLRAFSAEGLGIYFINEATTGD